MNGAMLCGVSYIKFDFDLTCMAAIIAIIITFLIATRWQGFAAGLFISSVLTVVGVSLKIIESFQFEFFGINQIIAYLVLGLISFIIAWMALGGILVLYDKIENICKGKKSNNTNIIYFPTTPMTNGSPQLVNSQKEINTIEQPTKLYHGTSNIENAMDIFKNNRFLIGYSQPYAVWLTPEINLAKCYTLNEGGIVEFSMNPAYLLTQIFGGQWIAEVPNKKEGKYYRVPGLTPIAVYDAQMNLIA